MGQFDGVIKAGWHAEVQLFHEDFVKDAGFYSLHGRFDKSVGGKLHSDFVPGFGFCLAWWIPREQELFSFEFSARGGPIQKLHPTRGCNTEEFCSILFFQ